MATTKKKPRANRDGTIYKHKKIVKGHEYVYHVAEVTFVDEQDRVRRLRAERSTASAAKLALNALRDQVRAGNVATPEVARRTVLDVVERWLSDAEARGLRDSTLRSYRQIARSYVIPHLGHLRVLSLTRANVKSMLDAMDGTGARTRQLAYIVAKSALAKHVRSDAYENPFPSRGGVRVKRREMRVWSEAEVRSFLGALDGDRLVTMYRLALDTGMRQGELFGLRWGDVGSDHVVVRASLDQRSRKIEGPKTATGRRKVLVQPSIIADLALYKERQKGAEIAVGADSLVFTTPTGEALHSSNVQRRSFVPLMQKAGVKPIRFHDMRHTSATLALGRGVPVKVVSERLGHASIRITLDTYAHVLPTMQSAAIETMADLFQVAPPRDLPGNVPRQPSFSAPQEKEKPLHSKG